MSLIELKDLHKQFTDGAKQVVLPDINLNIEKGELASIIGPSGSGKSTLMHILGLLDVPTSGSYRLHGEEMSAGSDSGLAKLRRNEIGFVFQSFNLLPRLSVLQNVMLPMAYSGVPAKARKGRAMELLGQVGIGHLAKNRVNQISGGETQRVAIARALANRPSLILADEPTGNLDSKSSQGVLDLLKKLHKRGNTIVIVTHNHEIAGQTDHIIELRDGKIVKETRRGEK